VILDKLQDLQLALVVCRLYEIDDPLPDSVCQLLYDNILGMDSKGENYNPHKAHVDPFLRSMALWMVRDYQGALNTLLEVGHVDREYTVIVWEMGINISGMMHSAGGWSR
jgi:hypothetical protein